MKATITASNLTGLPGPSGWAIVHDFTPANDETYLKKGRLIFILSMESLNGVDLPLNANLIVGKEILMRFHEDYFNKEGDTLSLLKSSVQEIANNFTSPNQTLSLLASVFIDNKIFIVSIGKVEGYVLRGVNLAKLVSVSTNISSIAGFILNNDKFFFGTENLFTQVTPDLIKSSSFLDSVKSLNGEKLAISAINIEIETKELPKIEPDNTIKTIPISSVKKPISSQRLLIASLIDRIISILPTKEKYIKDDLINPENNKRRKKASIAGFVLLLLLIVSIFFGIKQKTSSDARAKYEPQLNTIRHNLNEAKNLSSINEAKSRDLILNAKKDIDNLKSQNIKDTRITDLANEIEVALGQVAGIYQSAPSPYRDLSLQSSGFIGDDMSQSEDRLVVLDKKGKRLISLNIETKSTTPLAGPDIMPNAYHLGVYSDRNFVTSNNEIWEIGAKATPIITKDSEINESSLIASYAGNIYVLNKSASKVWRYTSEEGLFKSKQNWFGPGIEPDLSKVVSWTLDGNIWMLTRDGDVLKFGNSSPINFSLKGMDKDIQGIDIFTTQESKYLYILDSGNERVLVIDKEGNYKAQYFNSEIKKMTKIAVSEKSKKIILLSGSNLYSLDIKHL